MKLSDLAIRDETILLAISKHLKTHALVGMELVVEISETAAATQVKFARAFVRGLKLLGCGAALDDFGSSLGSLKLLSHVDVDFLKIDSSFITELPEHPENQVMVKAIHESAEKAGRQTIAPAVADAPTLAVLWQCGIKYAQGDYIQEPATELSYDFTEQG
jgi:EAL domain-containing protein (putative c-di-GMP-specific phosphodiesterase class I)